MLYQARYVCFVRRVLNPKKSIEMIVVVGRDPEFVHVIVYCLKEIRCAVAGFVVSDSDPIEPLAKKMAKLNPKVILVPETSEKQSIRILASFRQGSKMSGINLAPILRYYFESMQGN